MATNYGVDLADNFKVSEPWLYTSKELPKDQGAIFIQIGDNFITLSSVTVANLDKLVNQLARAADIFRDKVAALKEPGADSATVAKSA